MPTAPCGRIALGTYVRLRDPARAEVAFAVADELQRPRHRQRLLERLAAHARAAGIERFVAQVLPENLAMLRVFGDTGFEAAARSQGGVVEVEFALTPRPSVLDRHRRARPLGGRGVAARRSSSRASVAVIGASARRGTIGGELFRNVIAADFAGAAYPVNPKGDAGRRRRAATARSSEIAGAGRPRGDLRARRRR